MNPQKYDAILIGTGQAAGTLIAGLLQKDWKIAIVEGAKIGGTCVNDGCSPTKTLVASARAAHVARRGADFGVNIDHFSIDFAKVMERVNHIRTSFSGGLEGWFSTNPNITLYRHFAQFESPTVVRVGDELIESERIYLNVGARPFVPTVTGLDQVEWLDNRKLLDLSELPQHLLIIGGSYIGIEFAQAYRRLGSAVTIIERAPQIMFREDADIAQIARDVLQGEGIRVVCEAELLHVARGTTAAASATFKHGETEETVEASHLLFAIGRVPNSDTLNLSAAGIQTNERGFIVTDDHLLTTNPHVWALGDVNGKGAFTHTAVNDAEIVLDNLDGGTRKVSDRIVTYAMYMDPPLGRVGMSEKDARQSGRAVLMATKKMSSISRALEKDETHGLVKLIVDAETDAFLGATILGIEGDELINLFTPLMMAGVTWKQFRRTVLTHPTVAELMPWTLDNLRPLE